MTSTPGLSLELLSSFALRRDETRLPVPVAVERLLAFVALGNRRVSRARVAGALWPGSSPSRSTGCLRTALWRLRRVSDGVLVTTGTDLVLGADVRVDVLESFTAIRRMQVGEPGLPPHAALPAWLTADLLPDWSDDWVIGWRGRWRMLRLHVLEMLAARLATAGRFSEAVDVALCAIHDEPLRESAHRSLISAHLAAGNRAEAVLAYHRLSSLLGQELGISPSPDIAHLLDHIDAAAGLPSAFGPAANRADAVDAGAESGRWPLRSPAGSRP